MRELGRGLALVFALLLFLSTQAASAQGSGGISPEDPYEGRLALSLLVGGGIPVGQFSDSNRGNHKAGGVDVGLEAEWYFSPHASVGLALWGGIYDDETLGDQLQTDLTSAGGFLRFTLTPIGQVAPFGKIGVGWTELEFQEGSASFKADGGTALMVAGGILGRVSRLVSVNGQVSYNHSFLEESAVPAFPNTVVGFDVQYIAIDVGVSVYFQL
jgi:hypothetical protein